jgi:hypothetical protein
MTKSPKSRTFQSERNAVSQTPSGQRSRTGGRL